MNDLFLLEHIFLDLPQSTPEELFRFLLENEGSGAIRDKEVTLQDILARENELSTGFIEGLAIPHGISTGVTKTSLLIAKMSQTLPWETLDGKPVSLVFLILSPKDAPHAPHAPHLKALAQLAEKLTEPALIKNLLETQSREELLDYLQEENT